MAIFRPECPILDVALAVGPVTVRAARLPPGVPVRLDLYGHDHPVIFVSRDVPADQVRRGISDAARHVVEADQRRRRDGIGPVPEFVGEPVVIEEAPLPSPPALEVVREVG